MRYPALELVPIVILSMTRPLIQPIMSIALIIWALILPSIQSWTCPQLINPSYPSRSTGTHQLSGLNRLQSRLFQTGPGSDADDSPLNNVPKNITELAEKRVRLAKAQEEIDRILNSPVDPPFDAETEFKKVVSISPPLIAEDSPEYLLEQKVSLMEEELYKAVKDTDFDKAAKTSAAISQMHIDDCGLVLQVNSKFYKSFSRKDMDDMNQLWLKDKSCVCIHPSMKPLVGIKAIHESWERMFDSSNGSFQRNWMEPHDIRLTVKATTAIITCEEHVFARRFVRGKKRQTELINKLQATNIFRKVGGRWYLTYHHSSWHADSDAAKQALKNQGSTRSKKGSRKDDDNEDSQIDNILGVSNFGPLLGDDSDSSKEKPVKRVIMGMGSLSDILNGNLGDLLGDGDGGSKGDDENIDGDITIHFTEGEDDEDDDEDDVEDAEIYDKLQDLAGKPKGQKVSKVSLSSQGASSKTKDQAKQGCIASLRKLASQGRISQNQKRTLLTDIITCSSKGEKSMVEVAHEILFAELLEGEELEDAEDEFADQCVVVAKSLEESMYS